METLGAPVKPKPSGRNKPRNTKDTYGVGKVMDQTTMHALTQITAKRQRSTAPAISTTDDLLLRRIAGVSAQDFRDRLRDRLSGLADEIVDKMRDKVDKIRPDSLAYALEVVVNKMDQLNAKASVQNAHFHFHAPPGAKSKEQLIAELTGAAPFSRPIDITAAQPPLPTSPDLPPSPTPQSPPGPIPAPTESPPPPLPDTPPSPTPSPSEPPPASTSPSSPQELEQPSVQAQD